MSTDYDDEPTNPGLKLGTRLAGELSESQAFAILVDALNKSATHCREVGTAAAGLKGDQRRALIWKTILALGTLTDLAADTRKALIKIYYRESSG